MTARLAALALVASVAFASPADAKPTTTEAPFVELLTFGVGNSLFEAFGHAALCLRYADPSYDVCFNYGVTDYDEGAKLIWNFIQGTQVFWSEPSNYGAMIAFYQDDDRDIWVQQIPMTEVQARAVEDQLWHDVDPAYRSYVYDHVTNNCATRIRDLLDATLGGALSRETAATGTITSITLRQVEERGFAPSPLLVAAADFVLGREMDVPLTRWQTMFLPDFLRTEVGAKLDAPATQLHTRRVAPPPTQPSQLGRTALAVLALLSTLPFLLWRKRRTAALWIATLPLAFYGIAVWALATLSPIGLLRWNEALMIVLPLDLALPLFSPVARRRYARVRVLSLVAASIACAAGVLHQPLWMPIIVAIIPLGAIGFSAFAAPDPDRSADAGRAQS